MTASPAVARSRNPKAPRRKPVRSALRKRYGKNTIAFAAELFPAIEKAIKLAAHLTGYSQSHVISIGIDRVERSKKKIPLRELRPLADVPTKRKTYKLPPPTAQRIIAQESRYGSRTRVMAAIAATWQEQNGLR